MLIVYPHLQGRKAILDLRCSTTRQADTSIPQQEEIGLAFCKANGVTVIHTIKQEGVTATIPGARSDFAEILRRKRAGEDFNLLVMTDVSRFSRAGAKHGMSIEYELETEGIEVVFANNPLPQGDDGDLIRPAYYFAAKMYSKSMAHAIARGSMAALEAGIMAHCTVAPYGLDFLYMIEGKPLHITRTLPDGRQLKLHPDALGKNPAKDQILQVFPKNPKAGKNMHYRKQPFEQVILVPGAPEALATIIEIFMLALKGGWGGSRIAGELNERGVPAPRGGLWYDNTVDYILRNKTYLGIGIANMKTRAVYAARDTTTPKVRNVSARTLAKRKKPPIEIRPRADWKEKQYPMLAGLLGEDLRPLAERFINRALSKREGGYVPPEIPRHKHVDSDYILTGLLMSKQGGYRLGGYTVHAKRKRYRKYRITKFYHAPTRNPILQQRISAEPLENAVFNAMSQILSALPNQQARLAAAIRAEQKMRKRDNAERDNLVSERDELHAEYKDLISMGRHGRGLAKQKIAQLETRLEDLESRIRVANDAIGHEIDPAQRAGEIIKELAKIFSSPSVMPKPLLKQLARLLISKLEIDLETLEFELEIALPSWAMINAEAIKSALRLEPNPHMRTSVETQPQKGLILGRFACSANGKPICFECHRLRRAA